VEEVYRKAMEVLLRGRRVGPEKIPKEILNF
jgi:hypothetical protein